MKCEVKRKIESLLEMSGQRISSTQFSSPMPERIKTALDQARQRKFNQSETQAGLGAHKDEP